MDTLASTRLNHVLHTHTHRQNCTMAVADACYPYILLARFAVPWAKCIEQSGHAYSMISAFLTSYLDSHDFAHPCMKLRFV